LSGASFAVFLAALLLAPAQDFLAEGLKALEANEPAAAEPLLRQAVQADPGDFTARFNLALSLSLQHKDTDAIAEFRKTLELKSGLYQANLNLGMLLLRNRQAGDALAVLKEAVETKPKEARPNLYYADALFQMGDAAQAEEHYRTALEADPRLADAEVGLARALVKETKLAEAEKHYQAAASLDSRYGGALLELAVAYEQSKQVPEAVAIYRQFPDNAAARERLAALLVQNKEFSAAIPSLERAVQSQPSTANRLALAEAYKINKQEEKAIEQLQLATASDSSNYDLRMMLGRELRDNHRNMPAAQQFGAATKIRPDSAEAWNELASILIVNENYAEGLAALDHVKALGKEIPGDMYYRAITLDRLKQLKPAVEAYRQFLAADGGKLPDQEFAARQRIRIIESELNRK
jgi:tetratricopeptide (TPR) repeat protein